jgi:hypothetical protein
MIATRLPMACASSIEWVLSRMACGRGRVDRGEIALDRRSPSPKHNSSSHPRYHHHHHQQQQQQPQKTTAAAVATTRNISNTINNNHSYTQPLPPHPQRTT